MTPPEELVKVAAWEMHLSACGCIGGTRCATWRATHEHMAAALAAAFAKLAAHMKAEVTGNDDDRLRAEGWNECIAALAKWGQR